VEDRQGLVRLVEEAREGRRGGSLWSPQLAWGSLLGTGKGGRGQKGLQAEVWPRPAKGLEGPRTFWGYV
jgi:hypothetical protein